MAFSTTEDFDETSTSSVESLGRVARRHREIPRENNKDFFCASASRRLNSAYRINKRYYKMNIYRGPSQPVRLLSVSVARGQVLDDRLRGVIFDRSAHDLDHLVHCSRPLVPGKGRLHGDIVETVADVA